MLIGELLISKGLIRQAQLTIALDEQKKTSEFLGAVLVRMGFIKEEALLKALSEQFQMAYISLSSQFIDWEVVMRFSASLVVDRHVFPFRKEKQFVLAALSNPLDAEAIAQLETEAKPDLVKLFLAPSAELKRAVSSYQEYLALKTKKILDKDKQE